MELLLISAVIMAPRCEFLVDAPNRGIRRLNLDSGLSTVRAREHAKIVLWQLSGLINQPGKDLHLPNSISRFAMYTARACQKTSRKPETGTY